MQVAAAQPQACNPEAAQASLPGGSVHYLQTGNGPRVVLLHGLFAQKEQWVPLMCLIATAGHQVIAPDLPGFGQSVGFPLSVYRLENQVDLLHALLTARGIHDFDLAGNSMGGAIAGLYQRKFPTEVRTLAFIGAPLGVVDWGPRLAAALAQGVNPFIPVTPEQFSLELSLLFYKPPAVSADVVASLVSGYKANLEHYLAVWNTIVGYPRALVNAGVGSVRALALWGEADGVYDVSGLATLVNLYPGLRAERVARTGHLPMVEHPDDTARSYLEFLR
jgi:pimeloyl-ACP methyl ester carboxylesterase